MAATLNLDEAEVRLRGIEALNRALGPAGALRFLALIHRDRTDYVEVSRRLYEGQTVDEILERSRLRWRGAWRSNSGSGEAPKATVLSEAAQELLRILRSATDSGGAPVATEEAGVDESGGHSPLGSNTGSDEDPEATAIDRQSRG